MVIVFVIFVLVNARNSYRNNNGNNAGGKGGGLGPNPGCITGVTSVDNVLKGLITPFNSSSPSPPGIGVTMDQCLIVSTMSREGGVVPIQGFGLSKSCALLE